MGDKSVNRLQAITQTSGTVESSQVTGKRCEDTKRLKDACVTVQLIKFPEAVTKN